MYIYTLIRNGRRRRGTRDLTWRGRIRQLRPLMDVGYEQQCHSETRWFLRTITFSTVVGRWAAPIVPFPSILPPPGLSLPSRTECTRALTTVGKIAGVFTRNNFRSREKTPILDQPTECPVGRRSSPGRTPKPLVTTSQTRVAHGVPRFPLVFASFHGPTQLHRLPDLRPCLPQQPIRSLDNSPRPLFSCGGSLGCIPSLESRSTRRRPHLKRIVCP